MTKSVWLHHGNLLELNSILPRPLMLSSPCDVVALLSPWNASTLLLLLHQGSNYIYQGCLSTVLLWTPLTNRQLRGSIHPFINYCIESIDLFTDPSIYSTIHPSMHSFIHPCILNTIRNLYIYRIGMSWFHQSRFLTVHSFLYLHSWN